MYICKYILYIYSIYILYIYYIYTYIYIYWEKKTSFFHRTFRFAKVQKDSKFKAIRKRNSQFDLFYDLLRFMYIYTYIYKTQSLRRFVQTEI